jgi:hypothetical protein
MSLDVVDRMLNESHTPAEFREVCLVIRNYITNGRHIGWTTMHALSVKAHHIAVTHNDLMTCWEFLQTQAAEPATMEEPT